MIRKPYPCCNRERPSMKAIEGIALQIMREFSCLSNARDNGKLMRLYAELNHDILKDLEDWKITAPPDTMQAPLLYNPLIWASISPARPFSINGRPSYLLILCLNSYPVSALIRRANWPVALFSMQIAVFALFNKSR